MARRLKAVSSPVCAQRGLGLIELMIGMLLGLMLLGGVIMVYSSSAEVKRSRMAMSAIADSARFALEHMNRQLRMAGYGAGAPMSFNQETQTLTVRGASGPLRYRLDEESNALLFNDEILVDGIASWNVQFGWGDYTDGSVQFLAAELPEPPNREIWSARVELGLEDPTNPGNPMTLAANAVFTTVGLRNPLLMAVRENHALSLGSASPSVPGQDQDGTDPDTPADPDPSTPPDNDNAETPPPDPDPELPPPEVCVDHRVQVSVQNENYVFRDARIISGQGSFLGCSDDDSSSRTCAGRATGAQGFEVLLTFIQPNSGQTVEEQIVFQCAD